MTSGHNSLSNLNLFRLAFPLYTVTRCCILLRLCTAFDRDGKRFPRCIFPHSIGSVPYLTFIARRASRFALDPYLSYFCPNKKPRAGGKNAFPESKCCPTKRREPNANR